MQTLFGREHFTTLMILTTMTHIEEGHIDNDVYKIATTV
jgi:hypothetical protein